MIMAVQTRTRGPRYILNVTLFDQLMKRKGWTSSEDCAKALDLHHSTIARLRAMERTPSYQVARAMSEYFEIPHDLLFIPEEES